MDFEPEDRYRLMAVPGIVTRSARVAERAYRLFRIVCSDGSSFEERLRVRTGFELALPSPLQERIDRAQWVSFEILE